MARRCRRLKLISLVFEAPAVQGGIFAQGERIHIDHCIFYNCKNALLSFLNVKDFSITHSLIYGAYEAAMWLGYGSDADLPFTFHDNRCRQQLFLGRR